MEGRNKQWRRGNRQSQGDSGQESWPRQQKLPEIPRNNQRETNHNRQGDATTAQQQGKQQQQQQQKQPLLFKPPPARPNAWKIPSKPEKVSPSPFTSQSDSKKDLKITQPLPQATQKAAVTSDPVRQSAQCGSPNLSGNGAMGAWATKPLFNHTADTQSNPSAATDSRIMKKEPTVIMKPQNPSTTQLPQNKNDKKKNNKQNSKKNTQLNNKQIHGKKPKLSSISMGDLVPNIKKMLPKDKNSRDANGGGMPGTETETSSANQSRSVNQSGDHLSATEFPALPNGSKWPSLATAKTSAPKVSSAALQPKKTEQSNKRTTNKNTSINKSSQKNPNKVSSKNRKNQAQQLQSIGNDQKKTSRGTINSIRTSTTKLDDAHLQAQFLFPPGKGLDPNHLQAQFSMGKALGGVGNEQDLMRRMQEGQVVKGRQRLKPRKKRFTALKRKILLERLRVWKELHPELDSANKSSTNSSESSCSICVCGFVSVEDMEDDEEYEEVLENLRDMADKVGTVKELYIPREPLEDSKELGHSAFVRFSTPAEAMAARGIWDGLVIGGQTLKVLLLPSSQTGADESLISNKEHVDSEVWRKFCLAAEKALTGAADETVESDKKQTCKVLLRNVLTEDDLEDDECFAESIHDIKSLVEQFGTVEDIQAKKNAGNTDVIVVYTGSAEVANHAMQGLQKLTLGGSRLVVEKVEENITFTAAKLLIQNILTEDDLEDDECLEESLNDIRSLLQTHGTVASLEVSNANVLAALKDMPHTSLQQVASQLNGMCIGGQIIEVSAVGQDEGETTPCVILRNLLTKDDLEDGDCLEESLEDLRELARQHGEVERIDVEQSDSVSSSVIKIFYLTSGEAASAKEAFDGMVIGGEIVEARTNLYSDTNEIRDGGKHLRQNPGEEGKVSERDDKHGEPKQMFSGDKRIPERFAECKRVPKVPNKGTPRNYALMTNDATVKPLLVEMLNELMRLQLRALHDPLAKNAKARRRVVVGLREVARGIRANKVKMVVMANNLDEYGAIDDKLQEILDLSAEKEIPVLFELSKRVLGKAVGKKIKVSVAGIQSTDGAHKQFITLSKLAPKLAKPPALTDSA